MQSGVGLYRSKISKLTDVSASSIKYVMRKEGMYSRQSHEMFDKDIDDRIQQLVMRFPNAGIIIFYVFVLITFPNYKSKKIRT